MYITSNYYRCRQHKDTLDLGVGSGMAHIVEHAALEAEPQYCEWPRAVKPLRPSGRTLRRLERRYKSTNKNHVAHIAV